MLESLLLTLSLSANIVCLPYDHRAIDVAEECYFSTTQAESNTEHMFTERELADKICVYTDRTVYAFYQENNYTPKGFAIYVGPGNPIITDIRPLSNNYDDLIFMVGELESAASSSGLSGSNLRNAVLGYIRTATTRYSLRTTLPNEITIESMLNLFKSTAMSGGWYAFAGPDQQRSGWYDYARAHCGVHKSYSPMNRYFARFATEAEYDSRHGALSDSFEYCWDDDSRAIPDFNGEGDIDVLHMFATLDACVVDTTPLPLNLSGTYFEREIAGWAGDLQSLVRSLDGDDIESISEDDASFGYFLSNASSSFSMSDLLADVDAKNISVLINNESLGFSVSQAMSFYRYVVSSNPTDRYTAFCQNLVTSMLGSGATATRANVDRAVHLALGRVQSGSSYVNDDLLKANYVLLWGHTNDANRDRVAELFADYICGEAGIS